MDVAPPSEIVSKFSNTTADPVSARHKALRDLEDFKRTLGGKLGQLREVPSLETHSPIDLKMS